MSKYRFNVTLTIHGHIEAETDSPGTYAEYLEGIGISTKDLTFISGDEVEVDYWDEVRDPA